MSKKLRKRSQPLTIPEQRHLVDKAIPDRVSLIERCISGTPPTFGRLTTAAVHARALAGFLGIGADHTKLWADKSYHDHGDEESYEVKVSDIKKDALFTKDELGKLSPEDQEAIRVGFNTTNCEFVHLTFWSDPAHQQPDGAPRNDYIYDLADRVSRFAQTVIYLLRQRLKDL